MKKTMVLISLLALSGCGYSVFDAAEDVKEVSKSELSDGTPITTTAKTTASFDGIEARGSDDVIFVTGTNYSIRAQGSAEAIAKLRFKIKDGQILVGREDNDWKSKDRAVITITAPAISQISNAGSGAVKADKVSGDNVAFSVAGSGEIKVAEVKAKSTMTNIAGSGSAIFAGTSDSAEYSVAGSGDIDASKLLSKVAEASIAGSGDVNINVSDSVEASIVGSGSVNVTGGAKCQLSKVGSGNLNCS
jgi:hypothetical protein